MSKDNKQWSEYIILGDTVNIYNSDNVIGDKRELFPNIDDVLILENRISYLQKCSSEIKKDYDDDTSQLKVNSIYFSPIITIVANIINFGLISIDFNYNLLVASSFLLGSYSTGFVLNSHKSNVITNNYLGVSELYISEIEKTKQAREVLLSDTIDEDKVVREQIIKLREDRDYGYELLGRESIFEDYNKIRKKIKREKGKEKLDEYMDSIGCTEEDKKILLEIYDKESIKPRTMHKQLVRK